MSRLSYFGILVLVILIACILIGCIHPAIKEARERAETREMAHQWKPVQWEPIPAPVDMEHCEVNSIFIGKPKCD